MFAIQSSMRIAWISRLYCETLFPLRQEARLQKVVGSGDTVDSRQAHFFHQAVLQGPEQPLDAPFGMSIQLRRMAMLRFDVSE